MNENRQVTIFLGPPGSGKGSLSQYCVDKLGWAQLSTGTLCRKHIQEATDIGKQIDFSIKSGKLVDDKLIVDMVQDWLIDHTKSHGSVILDGFPRNKIQAERLSELLDSFLPTCKVNVIRLTVSRETLMQRILNRCICSNKDCQAVYTLHDDEVLTAKNAGICDICSAKLIKRADDTSETLSERLKVYYEFEDSMLDFYAQQGFSIHEINVEKPIDLVFNDFFKVIN